MATLVHDVESCSWSMLGYIYQTTRLCFTILVICPVSWMLDHGLSLLSARHHVKCSALICVHHTFPPSILLSWPSDISRDTLLVWLSLFAWDKWDENLLCFFQVLHQCWKSHVFHSIFFQQSLHVAGNSSFVTQHKCIGWLFESALPKHATLKSLFLYGYVTLCKYLHECYAYQGGKKINNGINVMRWWK